MNEINNRRTLQIKGGNTSHSRRTFGKTGGKNTSK